jgi:hypothetical protein
MEGLIRFYSRWAILLCAVLLTRGCATALTLDASAPGKETDEINYVEKVTSAWHDEAGNVTLCVIGLPAGTNHGLDGSRSYSIFYPGASPPEPLFALHEAIPIHIGVATDVKGACSPSMKSMTPIPVHTVHDSEFRDTPYTGRPDRAMATFLENYAPAPTVFMYQFKVDAGAYSGEHMKLFYVRETAIWDDIRVVEILTAQR